MIESARCWSNGVQDALAQQVEVGATVHLSLDHFDAIDIAFHRTGVVRQHEAVEDRGVVTAQTTHEPHGPGDTRNPLADIDPAALNLDELTTPLRTMTGVPAPDDALPNITDWLGDRLSNDHLTDLPPGETAAPRAERTGALRVLDELSEDVRFGLCHGDASPWNILTSHPQRCLLIDPRGMSGEVEYDAAVLALKLAHFKAIPAAAPRIADAAQFNRQRVEAWEVIARTARV